MPDSGRHSEIVLFLLFISIAAFFTFYFSVELPKERGVGTPKPIVIEQLKVEERYAEFIKDQAIVKFKERIKGPSAEYLDTREIPANDLRSSNFSEFFSPLIDQFKLLAVSRIHQEIDVDTSLHLDRVYLLKFSEDIDLDKFIAHCNSYSNIIEYCEKDAIAKPLAKPNDPSLSRQWAVESMNLEKAWDITTGSKEIIIADIDDNFDTTHLDLKANFISGSPPAGTGSSHGTAVVGTFGAVGNNSVGIAGVDWEVGILGLEGFSSSQVAKSIRKAADSGAKVINMSFTLLVIERGAAYEAAKYAQEVKNVVLVAAAGNCLNDPSREENCRFVVSPQDWDNTISVAALKKGNTRAIFSSYYPKVELAAPGEDIYTTENRGKYVLASGTSFSSPLASGVAGLMFVVNPSLTYDQIREILQETAVDLGNPGRDIYYGFGKVDALAAVSKAREGAEPPPPPPPPPEDPTPPRVTLVYPEERTDPYSGNIRLEAEASDNVAVERVEFYVDDSLIDSDPTSPYQITWDSKKVSDGEHTFFAKAFDTSGNSANSSKVTITIKNAGKPPEEGRFPIGLIAEEESQLEFLNSKLLAGDIITVKTERLDYLGRIRTAKRMLMIADTAYRHEYPRAAEFISQGKMKGAQMIGFNLEGQHSKAELIEWEKDVQKLTEDAGLIYMFGPMVGDLDKYYEDFAKYTDEVVLQSQRFQLEPNYKDTVSSLIGKIKKAKPQMKVWVQVSVNPPADQNIPIEKVMRNIEDIADVIDGLFIFYGGDRWPVAKEVVERLRPPSEPEPPPPGDKEPPSVTIENPKDGETVSGLVIVSALARDNIGVASVEFFMDDGSRGKATTTPYSYHWDTDRESTGGHTLKAEAVDAAGNVGRSPTITVTVARDGAPEPPAPSKKCCGIGGCIYPPGRRSIGRDQCYYVCKETGRWEKIDPTCVSKPTMCCGVGGCIYKPGTRSRGRDGCLYVCKDTGLWEKVSCY